MKTVTLVLVGTLCAAPLSAQVARNVVVVPGQMTQVITDTMGTAYDIPYPSRDVYKALLAILADLKIPTEVKDSAGGRLESNVFYRSGSLGGKQLSTYLSCGEGITGPYADSYRVYMNAMISIKAKDAENSTLRTIFLGGAVAVAEGARQPMACESTGRLEVRLKDMVIKKIALF